jgi:choline-sulfatase
LCTWVDRQVGRVVSAVERCGLGDTTRIAYTSDHGDNVGARGMWGKSTHYDDAAGVPLILAGPGVPRGKVCRTPVSLVDFAPTILEAVGADPSDAAGALPGASLLSLAAGPDDLQRTVFSEYHAFASPTASFMLRDGTLKYIHYVGYPPELFDVVNDPLEERNLADEPARRADLDRLERRLRAVVDPEATDARAKAAQAALIARYGGPEKASGVGAPGATPAPV